MRASWIPHTYFICGQILRGLVSVLVCRVLSRVELFVIVPCSLLESLLVLKYQHVQTYLSPVILLSSFSIILYETSSFSSSLNLYKLAKRMNMQMYEAVNRTKHRISNNGHTVSESTGVNNARYRQ